MARMPRHALPALVSAIACSVLRVSLAQLPGEEHFPIVYVVYGPMGTLSARAVVAADADCPTLNISLAGLPSTGVPSQLRGVGTDQMPYAFPVKVCEVELPRSLPSGVATLGGRPLPMVTQSPEKIVLVGDTGLRVKPKNLGTCKKPGPAKLYGIPQCPADMEVPFDAARVAGAYQDLSDWPLREQMDHAAAGKPDLVVHVGDYLYRQGPCAQNKGCVAINNATDPSQPGQWGDNWHGWYADFFESSLPLLAAAPWIAMRGNHEQCDRGGHGYFLFLDPRPLPANWTAEYCQKYTEAYTVPFEHQQFLVLDSSAIKDVSIDYACPSEGAAPQGALGEVSRYADSQQNATAEGRAAIAEQVDHFREQLRWLEAAVAPGVTNFLLAHHPMNGVACDQGSYVAMDWTLQQAMGNSTLEGIAATIHGHVHWFQGLAFQDSRLPMEIVVGNGGTRLVSGKMSSPGAAEGLQVRGAHIATAFTSTLFGYSVLTRGNAGSHNLSSLQVGNRGLPQGASSLLWTVAIPDRPAGQARRRLSAPVFV